MHWNYILGDLFDDDDSVAEIESGHWDYFVVTGCTWGCTSGAASDDKIVTVTIFPFQLFQIW